MKRYWPLGLLGLGLLVVLGLTVLGGVVKLPGANGETPDGPSASASAAPASPTAVPPTATPEPTPIPPPAGTQGVIDVATELGIITPDQVPALVWYSDATGDFFFPQPGQAPTRQPAEIDLQNATGFTFTLDATQAAALSDTLPCGDPWTSSSGTTFDVACNQDQPLAAGSYRGVMTTHAGGFPAGFPAAGLHSWSVFSDTDGDPATGFASGSEDNFLIGADDYMEMLVFENGDGEPQNYILATRMSDPVRPDTGQRQGNLPTTARVIWDRATGSMLWVLPNGDLAGDWNAGGFSTTDRAANSPETLAADALGSPGDGFRLPRPWTDLEG